MQCELSVECALEARLGSLLRIHKPLIKTELKDTNANVSSSSFSSSSSSSSRTAASLSSAESYQSQRDNVKYFAGYARFNQSKHRLPRSCSCIYIVCVCVCVCVEVYTNIICKSGDPETMIKYASFLRSLLSR